MVTESLTIRESTGIRDVSGEVYVSEGVTSDADVAVVKEVKIVLEPSRYADMDEDEETEAMRHLSLKALEGQWDDDEPDKAEL